MSINNSTEKNLDCNFDRSTIFDSFTNWMIIFIGLLATVVNSVIFKTSYKLNQVIQKRAKTNRYATLPSLTRSHSTTYFFLILQSAAHTLVSTTLITQILIIMYNQLNYGILGLVVSIFKEAVLLVSIYQAIYIVTERYWSLVFPLRTASHSFSKRTIYTIWMLSVLLCIPDKLSLLERDIFPECAMTWLISQTRFSNHYFIAISIIPVFLVYLVCFLTLRFLRVTQSSKMFTYNKSVKALKIAVTLTRCEMVVLLVYAIPLGFLTLSSYLQENKIALKMLRCSYILLPSNSMLYPVAVLYNYRPIRRKVKTMFRLYTWKNYRLHTKSTRLESQSPITLVSVLNYKSTET